MNIEPLLDALSLQEDAARSLAAELRTQITAPHESSFQDPKIS